MGYIITSKRETKVLYFQQKNFFHYHLATSNPCFHLPTNSIAAMPPPLRPQSATIITSIFPPWPPPTSPYHHHHGINNLI
jgi:hypothetical protein